MIVNTSRYIWSSIALPLYFLATRINSLSDVYHQFRPLLLLPFNIWFFFVTLPFRVLFYVTSTFTTQNIKSKTNEIREKAVEMKEEIKEEAKQILPATLVHRAPIELRPLRDSHALDESRIHGFFTVEKTETRSEEKLSRRSSLKKSTEEKKSEEQPAKVDEKAELAERLAQMEEKERIATEEKSKIEKELEELTKKYESDESALAHYQDEHRRYKSMISVEQRKCFDLQREVVNLKVQLKSHESKPTEQPKKSKKSQKQEQKPAAEKVELKTSAPSSYLLAASQPEDALLHPHGWKKPEHSESFTEMVDRVQHEEIDTGKTFSETLREAIQKEEEPVAQKPTAAEFIVVGGPESSHHVFTPVTAK